MTKQILNKRLRYVLPVGGLALVATTVAIPLVVVTKNSKPVETYANLSTSTNILQSYKVRTPYTVDVEGFIKMMNEAKGEYLNQFGIDYTDVQIKNWFNSNTKKAIETIEVINARIMQRGFWDAIWSGIKGVAAEVAGVVVKTVDEVTNGNFTTIHNTANDLLDTASDLFGEAKTKMDAVNWGEVGAWWIGVGTNALAGLETALLKTNVLTNLATTAEINNILIPIITDKIKKEAPNKIMAEMNKFPQFWQVLNTLGVTSDDMINAIVVEKYNGSRNDFNKENIIEKSFKYDFSTATYLYGIYNFKLSFDFHKTKLSKESADLLNSYADNMARLISVTIHE